MCREYVHLYCWYSSQKLLMLALNTNQSINLWTDACYVLDLRRRNSEIIHFLSAMHKPNSGCGNITFIFRRTFLLWKHSCKAETRQIQHYIVQLETGQQARKYFSLFFIHISFLFINVTSSAKYILFNLYVTKIKDIINKKMLQGIST